MNKADNAAASAASKPRDRGEVTNPSNKSQKPYLCPLTRAELKAIIAEQLG